MVYQRYVVLLYCKKENQWKCYLILSFLEKKISKIVENEVGSLKDKSLVLALCLEECSDGFYYFKQ